MIQTGLQNKVVLITGANHGIGAATAKGQGRWVSGQMISVSGGRRML